MKHRFLILFSLAWVVHPAAVHADSWNHPPTTAVPGMIHQTFDSRIMKCTVGYTLFLPPGYDDDPRRRYPVVYVFHGTYADESTLPDAFAWLTAAMMNGDVPPMILVFAFGGRTCGFMDWADGSTPAESVILRELIPLVDHDYRTIPDRSARGVTGFSMGGGAALRFAFKYPDRFSAVLSYASGASSDVVPDVETARRLLRDDFDKAFAGDMARLRAELPDTLLKKSADQVRGKTTIRLVVGTQDQPVVRNSFKTLDALLSELRVPHQAVEVRDVGHDMTRLMEQDGLRGMQFLGKALGQGAAEHK